MRPEPSRPPIPALGTVLGVWAHPDDEAYLSAGLMALARRHGQRVAVVTATAGEAGNPDDGPEARVRTATRRRREMHASLAAVGVQDHQWLELPDGGCADVPADDAVELVRRAIERVRPDTILTFGPDGMTGHPDHKAVSAWTTAAWRATGGTARLWYATLSEQFHVRWGELNDRMQLWSVGEPPRTPTEQLACAVELHGDVLAAKLRALRAHASQTSSLVDAVGADLYARWWSEESFRAA
jgi:LmbE family N-acetylglucosaminyl deacetylase